MPSTIAEQVTDYMARIAAARREIDDLEKKLNQLKTSNLSVVQSLDAVFTRAIGKLKRELADVGAEIYLDTDNHKLILIHGDTTYSLDVTRYGVPWVIDGIPDEVILSTFNAANLGLGFPYMAAEFPQSDTDATFSTSTSDDDMPE